MPGSDILLLGVLGAIALGFGLAWTRARAKLAELQHRFAPIIRAEAEATRLRREAEEYSTRVRGHANQEAARVREAGAQVTAAAKDDASRLRSEAEAFVAAQAAERARWEQQVRQLSSDYGQAKSTYDRLKHEVGLLEENLEDLSYGLYRPHFTFQSSADYKRVLEQLQGDERTMIRDGRAAVCHAKWEVGGSSREGERMTKQYVKLMLRAFNGECDAAVAKVSWNNLAKMEERIRKTFETLNKLGSVMQMEITEPYLQLRLRELQFTHEEEEKRQQEREEQRRVREQRREEERVQRELATAQQEAEQSERGFNKALEKARREAERSEGAAREALAARIAELENQLAEAHARKERAIAQAQLTRCGHVYVLSNMGSFGDGVIKVGMTRRLEPLERVAELGDASVPFPFDVHALIYTEDAPDLETALHEFLWAKRINLANDRKEFFRATLEDVETFVRQRGVKAEFVRLAEAKEYRQTTWTVEQQRLAAPSTPAATPPASEFPDVLAEPAPLPTT